MSDNEVTPTNKFDLLARVLFMVLMALAYYVTGTVIFIVTVIQIVMVLLTDAPIERLVVFGRSLASYMRQIVNYLTFVTEDKPFPFSDWPVAD